MRFDLGLRPLLANLAPTTHAVPALVQTGCLRHRELIVFLINDFSCGLVCVVRRFCMSWRLAGSFPFKPCRDMHGVSDRVECRTCCIVEQEGADNIRRYHVHFHK